MPLFDDLIDHHRGCPCDACAAPEPQDGSVDAQGGGFATNGKAIVTADAAAANLTRSGLSWTFNSYDVLADGVLNFGFWDSFDALAASYYVSTDGLNKLDEAADSASFSTFSATQIVIAERAIGLWDDLVAIRFARTDAAAGDINFGNTRSAPGSAAYAYLPFGDIYDVSARQSDGFAQIGRVAGDVWIDASLASNGGAGANGSRALMTMIHEIGHALGLSHTGDYNAGTDANGDGVPDPIAYATHAAIVQDTQQYSVMSYFTADKSGAVHIDWHNLAFVSPATPMVHDVLAVQSLYGADLTTRTGDTVYGFNSNADRDAFDFTVTRLPVVTIWDAGGNDTLDLSGWNSASTIDLAPGAFSSGGGTGFLTPEEMSARYGYTADQFAALKARYGSTDGMMRDNIAIAYGAVIENAVGGGGDDRIFGNAVANTLTGLAGADRLDGRGGADRMIGGLGDDVYVIDDIGDAIVELASEGVDTVETALAAYRLGDYLEALVGTASAGQSLRANAGDNRVTGGAGNDLLDLSDGGEDFAFGGAGDDGFVFAAAFTAADRVDGGAGGNDQIALRGDYSAGLTLAAGSIVGVEVILVQAGFDYVLTSVDANVAAGGRLTLYSATLGAGDAFTFDGSAEVDGAFVFFGGPGTETVTGGSGNDGFYFGPDNFSATDRIAGGGGVNDQLGLDGDYSLTLGGNVAGVETLVLYRGPDGDLNRYTLAAGDDAVAAGMRLTVYGVPVETGFVFDGSAERDGTFLMFGGAGGDVLTGGAGADTFFGLGGADILNGGGGGDLFVYDAAAESTGVGFDRIVGFDFATDRIDLPGAIGRVAAIVDEGSLGMASFDADLARALNGVLDAGGAAAFVADAGDMAGRHFLVVDANGIAGYQAGEDFVVEFVDPVAPLDPRADFMI